MASKIKNYYKRKPGSKEDPSYKSRFGDLTIAHSSPFLGLMAPGQVIQTIENNLYRQDSKNGFRSSHFGFDINY